MMRVAAVVNGKIAHIVPILSDRSAASDIAATVVGRANRQTSFGLAHPPAGQIR
jgi:hypothetical protein